MPETAVDRDAIIEQLYRILASPLFRHSKRCGPLLKYIVMETIGGRGDSLKERTLGVAVFGRDAAYDTNEDPIVRSSAAEVRKRIAQYYHEPRRESEIRIDLTSGSYVPHFHPAAEPVVAPTGAAAPSSQGFPRKFAMIAGIVTVAVIGGIWAVTNIGAAPVNAFWGPLSGGGNVILGAGDITENGTGQPSFAQTSQKDTIGFADGWTMARVAMLLKARGVQPDIRRAGSLTLADLRRSPAVLIGEMNNPWSRLLEGEMRFRFVWDTVAGTVRLEDQQNPKQPLWQLAWNTPYAGFKEDRAIITRVVDPRTEHAVLVLAGCGRDGTTAAGEFVCEPKYLETLAQRAPRGWNRRNLQVVIATDLINGHTGPPRIVATHFW